MRIQGVSIDIVITWEEGQNCYNHLWPRECNLNIFKIKMFGSTTKIDKNLTVAEDWKLFSSVLKQSHR